MKTLTENLKEWRKTRNITNPSYINFVENILEELLEPLYDKNTTDNFKKRIIINDTHEVWKFYGNEMEKIGI